MAIGSFNWFVTVPQATRNLVTNPSFEFGTAGWATDGVVTIGSVADTQWSGAWTGRAFRAGGTLLTSTGVYTGYTVSAAGSYTLSAYVRANTTGSVALYATDSGLSGLAVGSIAVGTDWQRMSLTYGEASSASRNLYLRAATPGIGTLYVDAVQVEATPLTTYCDGDQPGCTWEGAAHASASFRGAQERSGGTIYSLASVGARPETTPDTGMWPVLNIAQSYAVNAGAQYQRQRPDSRAFTLTATLTGQSLANLHQTRRNVIDVLKLERTTTPQPTRLYYTGAQGTSYLDAYYDQGLGWDGAGVVAEQAQIRFVAHDPAWYGVGQQGTSLAPYTVLGSTNFIAYRDPEGRWGTMQTGGTSVSGTVFALLPTNGTVFVGGPIVHAGGTLARDVAMWANGAWGTLSAGTIGHILTPTFGVSALYQNAGGTIFLGGDFDTAAGTTANRIAMWTASGFGTLAHGSALASNGLTVYTIVGRVGGGIYVGGEFVSAGGTQAPYIAQWTGAWGSLGPGTVNNNVFGIVAQRAGSVVIGGIFTTVRGTTAPAAAQWNSTTGWGTLGGGTLANPSDTVALFALARAPDTSLYGGGVVAQPGTGMVQYRGASWFAAGTVGASTVYPSGVRALQPLANGNIYAGGVLTSINAGLAIPIGLALYNGYTWLPPDLIISSNTSGVRTIAQSADGTLYIGGEFRGIGTAASVATIVNTGMAEAYPTLRLRNTGAGTARVYQLLNTTTDDSLWFDYVMSPGEQATLVLTPGNRSFTSSSEGNIIGAIMAGANLASWRLLPGTNTVSFLADSPSIAADLYWTPRHSSIDGGAPGTY